MLNRSRLFFYTLFLVVLCCSAAQAQNLNGRWTPIYQEMAGKALPENFYAVQSLIIADSTYKVLAESEDKGTISYKDGKMDIYGKEGINAGRHIMAIYKVADGKLTICYILKGDRYPEAFETKGSPFCFMSVYEKAPKK